MALRNRVYSPASYFDVRHKWARNIITYLLICESHTIITLYN